MVATSTPRRRWLTALLVIVVFGAVSGWYAVRKWHPSAETYPTQGVSLAASIGPIDWAQVHGAGAEFAYLLATSGSEDRDSGFLNAWAETRAAGLRRGAVHVWRFCRLARDQATNFIATVPRTDDALPPAIRLEMDGNCGKPPARDVMLQELATFITLVEAYAGQPVVLHVAKDFEGAFAVSGAIDRSLWLDSFPFPPTYGERPWVMWQSGNGRSVDGIPAPVAWTVVRS